MVIAAVLLCLEDEASQAPGAGLVSVLMSGVPQNGCVYAALCVPTRGLLGPVCSMYSVTRKVNWALLGMPCQTLVYITCVLQQSGGNMGLLCGLPAGQLVCNSERMWSNLHLHSGYGQPTARILRRDCGIQWASYHGS